MNPEEKDIEEAKAYISKRIEYQEEAGQRIGAYIMEAARRIYDLSLKYNIPPRLFHFSANEKLGEEVDEVLQWLRYMIRKAIEHAVTAASEDDENDLLAYMQALGDDKSVSDRINLYVDRYKYELEAFLAAGFAYGLSKSDIMKEIRKSLGKPYAGDLLKRAFGDSGFKATRIRSKGISYGAGQYNSSKNAIDRLANATIGIIWFWWQGEKIRRSGASFFYQMRGSSYPCELCDSLVGVYPIDEIDGAYPHAHCYCYRVPIYL
jgi:hypothetical protein